MRVEGGRFAAGRLANPGGKPKASGLDRERRLGQQFRVAYAEATNSTYHSQPAQASHRRFADEYLANGFNATAAFKHAYPNVTHESAMRNASRLLRDAEVAAYRSARMEKVLAPRHMSGDEALARLEMMARVNVHDFFDEKGQPLEPQKWPTDIAGCVRAFQYGQDGIKLTFVDPHTALRPSMR